ncbi:hypothetical protein M271_20635 [Streptomyces rapamycinicus NRRL 5491]|nr:hypothetical protein M271_20635 [Streptomyces rapamycinicus NRRL 5491]
MPVGVDQDVDVEAPSHPARAGEQRFHRPRQPVTGPGRADHGQITGAAPELPVEDEERQTAEVVTVQMGDQGRVDVVGFDPLPAHRRQAGRATVHQDVGRAGRVGGHRQAGLEPPAGAERVTAAHDRHPHPRIVARPGHPGHGVGRR